MAKVVIYAENSKEEIMEVCRYDSMFGIRIPVGLFAPDVTLRFEEDIDEVNEAYWKYKSESAKQENSDSKDNPAEPLKQQ